MSIESLVRELSTNTDRLIYLAMGIMMLVGIYGNGLFKLSDCSADLKMAVKKIDTFPGGKYFRDLILSSDSSSKEKVKELFYQKSLKYQILIYKMEVMQNSPVEGGHARCDIGEFFNFELLDQVGGNTLNEFVITSFTALGILGTFLGLSRGVSGFDTASSDSIMLSINHLLTGMGVAFRTSIVGITVSLAYGSLYKLIRSRAERNMDMFLDTFRQYVLSDGRTIVLNKLENALNETDSMGDKMADAFADKVASVLEEKMTGLANSMESAVQANQDYTASMDQLQNKMQEMSDSYREMAASIDAQVQASQGISDEIRKLIKKLKDERDQVEIRAEAIKAQNKEHKELLDKISLYEEEVKASTDYFAQQRGENEKAMQELSKTALQTMKDLRKTTLQMSKSLQNTEKEYLDVLAEYTKTAKLLLEESDTEQIQQAFNDSEYVRVMKDWRKAFLEQNEELMRIQKEILLSLNSENVAAANNENNDNNGSTPLTFVRRSRP